MALASNVSQIQCATNVITLKDIKKRLLPQTAHASVEVITPLSTINAFYAAFLVVWNAQNLTNARNVHQMKVITQNLTIVETATQ